VISIQKCVHCFGCQRRQFITTFCLNKSVKLMRCENECTWRAQQLCHHIWIALLSVFCHTSSISLPCLSILSLYRYTGIYLALFVITLVQYFVTSGSSPGLILTHLCCLNVTIVNWNQKLHVIIIQFQLISFYFILFLYFSYVLDAMRTVNESNSIFRKTATVSK
jgi:hypothetical protein